MYLIISIISLVVAYYLGYSTGYGELKKALKSKYIGAAYFLVCELQNYEQLASAPMAPIKIRKAALKRLRRKARALFSSEEWAKNEKMQMRR